MVLVYSKRIRSSLLQRLILAYILSKGTYEVTYLSETTKSEKRIEMDHDTNKATIFRATSLQK